MINKNLDTRTVFSTYTGAIGHLIDCLRAGNVELPLTNWPHLENNKPERVEINLDKRGRVIVYFTKLGNEFEMIAKYKDAW